MTHSPTTSGRTARLATALLLLATVARAADFDPLRRYDTIQSAATALADHLKSSQNDFTSIDVGDFRNGDGKAPAPGTGIRREMEEAFRKAGVPVARDARWKLSGGFVADASGKGGPTLEIKWSLNDNEKDLSQVRRGRLSVVGTGDILTSQGGTGTIPAGGDEAARAKATAELLKKPSAVVTANAAPANADAGANPNAGGAGAGTVARASAKGLFGVEILVGGVPRPLKLVDGVLFFDLQIGESFEIHIVNNAPFDAGAAVSVDGVNVFAFQETPPGQAPFNDWRIGREGGFIRGWYVNDRRIDEFRHTPNEKEAAANLIAQTSDEIGTITAVFKAAWNEGAEPPADEPKVANTKSGIGRGKALEVDLERVNTNFGVIRESITVRYNRIGAAAKAAPGS